MAADLVIVQAALLLRGPEAFLTGLAKANSSASTGKTSTSTEARPPSATPCNAPAQADSPRSPTKTRASERRTALPARCVQSLKLHRKQQRDRHTAGTEWQHNGYAFTTPQGRPIDPTNLTRTFTTLLSTAGFRRTRFHGLRHSAATLLLEQGVELAVIKKLLGHAHIGVTATVYAHIRLRLQRQAIDTLGSALNPINDDPDDPPAAAVVRRRYPHRCRQDVTGAPPKKWWGACPCNGRKSAIYLSGAFQISTSRDRAMDHISPGAGIPDSLKRSSIT